MYVCSQVLILLFSGYMHIFCLFMILIASSFSRRSKYSHVYIASDQIVFSLRLSHDMTTWRKRALISPNFRELAAILEKS